MSKKRVCSLLLIFALVLASFNVNLVEANAAAKPNIKRVTLVSSVTTSVSWNKVSGASKYEVYCAKNNGNFKRVKTKVHPVHLRNWIWERNIHIRSEQL